MNTSNDLCVVGDRKLVAADNVAVALIEFAETAALGAFAAEVAVNLGNLEWENEIVVVLDDVACEWHSVVEAECLVGAISRLGGLINHINLFLGVTTGLCEENLGALDDWRLDI